MIRMKSVAGVVSTVVLLSGCELLGGGSGGLLSPSVPTASLRAVELAARPTNNNLAAFFCEDYASGIPFGRDACRGFFGAAPSRADIKFSFETVFDLGNANQFAIPTVEMLLGLAVFPGDDMSELGAVCVSFCDPEVEECEQQAPGEGCQPPDKTVTGPEDLVPTAADLVRIAGAAAAGNLFDDNIAFRVIPGAQKSNCAPNCEARTVDGVESLCCGDTCTPVGAGCTVGSDDSGNTCQMCPGELEARVRFDLGLDPMLNLLGQVLGDSGEQLLSGSAPSFDIPYDARGSLFFDIPVLGRHALGYGPLDGIWSLDD